MIQVKKYKKCPNCQTKNPPTIFECINCETDLTRIKVIDEDMDKMVEEDNSPIIKTKEAATYIRQCECGKKNPVNVRKCEACGEDISYVVPVLDSKSDGNIKKNTIEFILKSLDGKYTYKIFSEETIIGRENGMGDYLSTKSFVSRTQAKIIIEDEKLYVENLSLTNPTYVNNKIIKGKTQLNDGDELGLGGMNIKGQRQAQAAYFLVRIK